MLNNVYHLAYIVCAPVGGMFMVTINVMAIFIFVRVFRLQSFTLIMMVNICLCDIFVCLVSNMFYVVNLIHPKYAWSTGNYFCKLFKIVTMFTNVAQIFSLCAINVDRMRRVVHATKAQLNKFHGYQALVAVWVISFILAAPRWFLFEEKEIRRPILNTNTMDLVDTSSGTLMERINTTMTDFADTINGTSMERNNATTIEQVGKVVVNVVCKPSDLNATWYIAATIILFVAAYLLPSLHVLYTTFGVQLYVWIHRKKTQLATKKMNHALAMTFNLTAALFLAVWSPFFILSILDLTDNLLGNKQLMGANFTLRCTLLIIGSAKPIIYTACLKKFRQALICSALIGKNQKESSASGSNESGTHTQTTQ